MSPSFEQSVEGSIEQRFTVEVLYPVSKPTIYNEGHRTEIDTITVIRGQSVHLQCNSISNPPPTYMWSMQGEVSAQGTFMNQTIENDSVVVCNSSNCMDPTGNTVVCTSRLAYLNISTYFPPDKPVLRLTACGSSVVSTRTVKIIEGQSVDVLCTSVSNPEPIYNWASSIIRPGNILSLENVTASQNGTYSCTATNDMNTIFHGVVKGTNTSVFYLEVLLPPRVHQMVNLTVLLDANLSVVCPFTVGNPPSTTIEWIRENMTRSLGPSVSITGIKLTDEGRYTCAASNTMDPTNCNSQNGYSRTSFHLDVQYASKITKYFASGLENQNVTSVNDTSMCNSCVSLTVTQ
ncbi:hemicentin-2-like isoform X2 [Dreissena polymorpha]|uniref:hemicentin-2-like isoform X2 n=1 Tax=Dreissena polymorpha TaxID=45954 RepID=UPI002264E7A8|nr:hemicentin-2-like isoform X2 [Dreissena polymorpha]